MLDPRRIVFCKVFEAISKTLFVFLATICFLNFAYAKPTFSAGAPKLDQEIAKLDRSSFAGLVSIVGKSVVQVSGEATETNEEKPEFGSIFPPRSRRPSSSLALVLL